MIKLSLWDKIRYRLGYGYTKATEATLYLARVAAVEAGLKEEAEKAEALKARTKAREDAAKAEAKAKVAEMKASAEKKAAVPKPAAKKPVAKKAPAAKKPLHEASRDGDGDGFINDGKPNERRVAPKKAPAKKKQTK